MESIHRITAAALRHDALRARIYEDLEHTYYWDDSWDPELYMELAHAGFISIAHLDAELGPLLLPQLQQSYAVLDWDELHCSRNLHRLLRSERLANEDVELRIVDSVERVLSCLVAQHGTGWMLEPYQQLVLKLPTGEAPGFAIRGVELWSRRRNQLVAGELGYTIGRTYTSLSGFCSPGDPEYRHFGTLQLWLLAGVLRDRGYAFWNMGHPSQPYKRAIGARILARKRFLERWLEARDAALPIALPPISG